MKLVKPLLQPADNTALIVFRIAFGYLLAYHFVHFLLNGTIYHDFVKPPFTFTYIGFECLQSLSGKGMYAYVAAMVVLALLVMLGAWYRIAITLFSVMWTVLYLMQKSDYNNHYYLVMLLSWMMVFMPANRYFSLDVQRKAVEETTTCSRWCLFIFIAQMAIVYFFAAINKISADWFSGKFIAIQFSPYIHRPKLGLLFGQKWFQLFICYGGFLFDLLIVPLLLWKRTGKYAFILSVFFHLFNSFTFHIGIFPYLSIALNLFFIDPKYIHRFAFKNHRLKNQISYGTNNVSRNKILIYGMFVYLFFQLILPMRSWLFPGDVFWNEEGYRMSWKMMLRVKTGSIYFKVKDPVSGKTWIHNPAKIFDRSHVICVAISPDVIWQYSQQLKKDWSKKGYPNAEVYAVSRVKLNGSKPSPLVDSTVNLAAVKWQPFRHSAWITNGPLP